MANEYRFNIDMSWKHKDLLEEIPQRDIIRCIIDKDYDNKNMPIIIITADIRRSLLDQIILQKNRSTILLNISKYMDNDTKFVKDYIKDEFVYTIFKDINYNRSLDDNANDEEMYTRINIGLMKLNLINVNKKGINNVYQNCNKLDIICHNLNDIPMIIEPFKNDSKVPEFIIPPIESNSKLIRYLNSISPLYGTHYRYFLDFDYGYLMSTDGKYIDDGSKGINNIIFNIYDPQDLKSKDQGMYIDKDNNVYIIEVDASATQMVIDDMTDKKVNNIIGIDSNGATLSLDYNIYKVDGSTKKTEFLRVNNLNVLNNFKSKIEYNSASLRITKNDIDSSLFNMNKIYNINNFKRYSYLDGQWLLSSKKEIMSKDGENFKSLTIFDFKKI